MKAEIIKMFFDNGYSFRGQRLISDGEMELEFVKDCNIVKVQYVSSKYLVMSKLQREGWADWS